MLTGLTLLDSQSMQRHLTFFVKPLQNKDVGNAVPGQVCFYFQLCKRQVLQSLLLKVKARWESYQVVVW